MPEPLTSPFLYIYSAPCLVSVWLPPKKIALNLTPLSFPLLVLLAVLLPYIVWSSFWCNKTNRAGHLVYVKSGFWVRSARKGSLSRRISGLSI